MMEDTIRRLSETLQDSGLLRAKSLPDTDEVDDASRQIGISFPSEYRDFLLRFGGAMVGPFPVFGLRPVEVMGDDEWSVVEMTKRYRADHVPGSDGWIVISCDHAGNPVGLDRNGVVWIHDHDFGGISKLASSFEAFIRVNCLRLPEGRDELPKNPFSSNE